MVELWTGTILDVDEPSDIGLGLHGGNEIDRINKLLKGVNLTTEETTDVTINTDWYFYNNKLKFHDQNGHVITIVIPAGMTTNRTLTLPDATGSLATSLGIQPNNWAGNLQQFRSGFLKLNDTDESHGLTFKTSGLSENWDIFFPTPEDTGEEVILSKKPGQVLYDKILSNPTLAALTINIDQNKILHSTTNAQHDLMVYDTAYEGMVRFPKSTIAGQFLRTNVSGTGLEWATVSGGGGGGSSGTSIYDLLSINGYDIGWLTPNADIGFGLFSSMEVRSAVGVINFDAANSIISRQYAITSSTGQGIRQTFTPFYGQLNCYIEAVFKKDHHADFSGARHYLGLVSNPTAYTFEDSDELTSDSGVIVHTGSSNTDYAIDHNDGGSPHVRDISLEALDDGWHKIKIFSDGSAWKYNWDDGTDTTISTDVPAMTTPLGFICGHSRNDSTNRELYLLYAKALQKKGNPSLS